MKSVLPSSLALAALLAACGSAPAVDDGGVLPDPAELACAHLPDATAALTASAAPDASAPLLTVGPVPHLLTMPATGTGYVRVQTDLADETLIFFLREGAALTAVLDEAGAPLPLVSAGPNTFCAADLPEHFDVTFGAVGTYYIELTSAADVWLLASESGGHLP